MNRFDRSIKGMVKGYPTDRASKTMSTQKVGLQNYRTEGQYGDAIRQMDSESAGELEIS
jgi:hypothetical protein